LDKTKTHIIAVIIINDAPYDLLEFPDLLVNSIIAERRLAESNGVPIEVSRKGKAPPLERGRGKYSPSANPIGSLRKPYKRRNDGIHL